MNRRVASYAAHLILVAATTLGAGTGCSAETSEDTGTDEGAVSVIDIPGLAAVKMTQTEGETVAATRTVAASKKIESVRKQLGRYRQGAPRRSCSPTQRKRVALTFLDASGNEIGSASYSCDFGEMKLGAESFALVVRSPTALTDAFAAPPLPADILFGADKLLIEKPGDENAPKKELTDPEQIGALLGTMNLEELDVRTGEPTCDPELAVSFYRGEDDLGFLTTACSGTKSYYFGVTDTGFVKGGITVRLDTIRAAYEGAAGTR